MSRLLDNFKAPAIGKFDGITNLEDHLNTFEYFMDTLKVRRMVRCRLFLVYLSGANHGGLEDVDQKKFDFGDKYRSIF